MDNDIEVHDIRTEKGISTNNILQSLLLAATIGFGTLIVNSLGNLSDQVGLLTTNTTLNASNITHNTVAINKLQDDFDKHVNECKKGTEVYK